MGSLSLMPCIALQGWDCMLCLICYSGRTSTTAVKLPPLAGSDIAFSSQFIKKPRGGGVGWMVEWVGGASLKQTN